MTGTAHSIYGVALEQREVLMGLGDDATAREAQPWKSQLRPHLTPERSTPSMQRCASPDAWPRRI